MDVSQYLEIFIDESEEHLQTLSDCIMVLEKEPDNKDTINEVFRAAHSLKGMAGTMGFKRMQHLTHDMENVFQEVRSDRVKVTSGMIDLLFKCLDALEGYLDNIKSTSDEGAEDNEVIIKELNDFIAKADGEAEAENKEVSEVKEAAPAATQEEKEGQEKIELTEEEKKAIREAESNGQHIYAMTVRIQKDCLLKAARAFLVFKAVEDFGQILVYRPSSQDIEDEKFELDFSFFLASEEKTDKIVAAAKAVSEIEKVDAEEIHLEEYLKEAAAQEEQQAKEAATEQKEAPAEVPKAAEKKAPAAAAKKQTNAKPVTGRTVRVDIEKLDALMNQVSELIIAKNSLVSISSNESGEYQNQSFHEQIEYLERITTNLHESVMKVRMVPIESVVNKFPRMIRDLSRKLGKKMELYMTGEDTELDRTVVDQIGDPLQHLLRNSADHGLEDNATRVERGKPEVGSIFLKAFQEGNNVIIEVGDDGNGIDVAAVRDKAVERGVITAEQAENMSQKEIINLLFLPSFSMAKKITDISGRGVGLDVVKSNIEALGGDVEVRTKLGEGTTFIVRLPLTLAIIQALMVEIRDEKYAIALGSIANIESIPVNEIKYVQAQEVIHLRGAVIPLIRLDQVLDMEEKQEEPENLTVVIVKKGDSLAGLVVDNLIGQQEIVIKSLGKYITNNKIISGATILGDGEVALILDVNTLM
ncbi:MAG TPA: chemotaxis protein CheA [Roseburia sp.]|jgi:two-component system chemotaxis sensor kinase CheA|uniref:Chemotaxis protein CheA n=1 Tax=Roseburia inulinivorans TaxID=360807 RepID=A0A3R6DT59_9FIRM|nr:chemotaxis protein CheA [Roseburia inulinivorans]RHF86301.1 chemotaxis protein CheA [Roseburia inulinivorans]HCW30265.1 chemotaxis protein CheA [Roseburia sp.]